MPLKDAVEEIVKSVVQNVQQEIEKRLFAIVDEKLAEVKSEIVELAKEKVIEAIVMELRGEKPPAPPVKKPLVLTRIDVLGHSPIYRELLESVSEFGKGKTFTRSELLSHVESKFAGMKFWKGLRERTKLDYLNRHLSYLKEWDLAKLDGKEWSIVPGIKAGLMDIFSKRKEVKKEAAEKKKKLPEIKLSELTKVDCLKKRPIYKEVLDNAVALCSEKPMKRKELLSELEKRLATTAWAGYSLNSKKNYLTDHLRYLKSKGALKLENLRWSALPEAREKIST